MVWSAAFGYFFFFDYASFWQREVVVEFHLNHTREMSLRANIRSGGEIQAHWAAGYLAVIINSIYRYNVIEIPSI